MVEATRMWYQVTVSVMTDTGKCERDESFRALEELDKPLALHPVGYRAPPNSARAIIGRPYPMLITPSSPAEPVSSYARYPCPRDWNWPAHHMNIVPVQR